MASSRHRSPPPILSAQKTFRHRGPPLGTGASSRHRGLLQSSQHRRPSGTEGLLSAQGPPLGGTGASSRRHRGLLSAAQGPPLGGTGASSRRHRGLLSAAQGPPLSGTRASSQRHKSLLSAAQKASSRHKGLLSAAQGPHLSGTGPPLSGTRASSQRHRGPPLGRGASCRRHRGLLSAARGLLSAAQGPPLGIGASFNPIRTENLPAQRASSRYRGLLQYYLTNHRGLSSTVGLLPAQGPPSSSRTVFLDICLDLKEGLQHWGPRGPNFFHWGPRWDLKSIQSYTHGNEHLPMEEV